MRLRILLRVVCWRLHAYFRQVKGMIGGYTDTVRCVSVCLSPFLLTTFFIHIWSTGPSENPNSVWESTVNYPSGFGRSILCFLCLNSVLGLHAMPDALDNYCSETFGTNNLIVNEHYNDIQQLGYCSLMITDNSNTGLQHKVQCVFQYVV